MAACGLIACGVADAGAAHAARLADTAAYPVYTVVQEGLTQSQGAAIAQAYGIPNALATTGAFSYTAAGRFAQVPQIVTGTGTDKQGRAVTSQALDTAALSRLAVLPDGTAEARARQLLSLANLGPDFTASASVSHNTLVLADASGRTTGSYALDTTVSYQVGLAGLPVTGQGSRLRATFAPDGTVTQLSDAQRTVRRAGTVPVITVGQAAAECSALYGPSVRQAAPTLGYQFPALTAQQADGRGTVQTLYPQYTCNPVGPQGPQSGRLIPAVPGSGPSAVVTASRSGDSISASLSGTTGGTGPYTYQWSSSSTVLQPAQSGGSSIQYSRTPRSPQADEVVSVQITDADGLSSTAQIDLPGDGSTTAGTVPGGGGLDRLSTYGIENTVDYWQCAQDSANGFRDEMSKHAAAVAFDWRGFNSWENDFEDPASGGSDESWIDNVDIAWYTGHGNPNGFSFRGNSDSTFIGPQEISWGDHRLDWMQLESCQVLADTTNTNDYFSRWGPTMDGLHMLNGFHTSAYCVNGGTGGTFANNLFPDSGFLWSRAAMTVQEAWASMAVNTEPSGVVYRSMGPLGPGYVSDIGDYYWGQGPVGPDIFAGQVTGYWAIAGTV